MDIGWAAVLLIPFLGTALGAGMVLGLSPGGERTRQGLNGFAGGAMCAAAFRNLILPGTEENRVLALAGLMLGFLVVLGAEELGNRGSRHLSGTGVLLLAVVLHNIPEGMAVGMAGQQDPEVMLGIALQNIPDGAVVSIPLAAMGMGRSRAFGLGVLSGAVEPVAALGAMILRQQAAVCAPVLMGFAGGAMLYVILRELVPGMGRGAGGTVWFALGLGAILMAG